MCHMGMLLFTIQNQSVHTKDRVSHTILEIIYIIFILFDTLLKLIDNQ